MSPSGLKLVDEAIQKHGDDFWNDPNDGDGPNRGWIIEELLEILEKDNLDLEVERKNK